MFGSSKLEQLRACHLDRHGVEMQILILLGTTDPRKVVPFFISKMSSEKEVFVKIKYDNACSQSLIIVRICYHQYNGQYQH